MKREKKHIIVFTMVVVILASIIFGCVFIKG